MGTGVGNPRKFMAANPQNIDFEMVFYCAKRPKKSRNQGFLLFGLGLAAGFWLEPVSLLPDISSASRRASSAWR